MTKRSFSILAERLPFPLRFPLCAVRFPLQTQIRLEALESAVGRSTAAAAAVTAAVSRTISLEADSAEKDRLSRLQILAGSLSAPRAARLSGAAAAGESAAKRTVLFRDGGASGGRRKSSSSQVRMSPPAGGAAERAGNGHGNGHGADFVAPQMVRVRSEPCGNLLSPQISGQRRASASNSTTPVGERAGGGMGDGGSATPRGVSLLRLSGASPAQSSQASGPRRISSANGGRSLQQVTPGAEHPSNPGATPSPAGSAADSPERQHRQWSVADALLANPSS